MADSAQDRRFPATEKKIRKARAEGQVARSRDLGHLAILGLGGAVLVALAPLLTGWLLHLVADGLRFDAATLADSGQLAGRLGSQTLRMLAIVLPLGLLLAALAVAVAVLSGGWNFTLKAVQPKLGKVDPIAGFGRLFSSAHLIEVLKACGLALLLGTIAAFWLRAHVEEFVHLVGMPMLPALGAAGSIVASGLMAVLLVLVVFAVVDVPLQRHLLAQRLKMSHQELKEEHKQTEGSPEVKGRIRARMRQIAQRRMLAAVPSADIVVMNPTHYAVALKYDESRMAAPRVVAKGTDLMALRIRDAAKAADVPVLEAPPLARALHAACEIDQEVPAALFGAVAQVLAWVYQLRAAAGRGAVPDLPALHVPPELDPANKPQPRGADQ